MAKKKSAKKKSPAKKSPAKKATTKRPTKKSAPAKFAKHYGLEVAPVNLADAEDHPRNAEIREHPEPGEPGWDALRESLRHDYFDPLVFNTRNNKLVSGHLRKKVLLSEGVESADMILVDYDEKTHMARMVAANTPTGSHSQDGLKSFIMDLRGSNAIDLTGMPKPEVDALTIEPVTKSSGTAKDTGDPPAGGSSGDAYTPPTDHVPLVLAFTPTDHLDISKRLRVIRKAVADRDGVELTTVTNSDAVKEAIGMLEASLSD